MRNRDLRAARRARERRREQQPTDTDRALEILDELRNQIFHDEQQPDRQGDTE